MFSWVGRVQQFLGEAEYLAIINTHQESV